MFIKRISVFLIFAAILIMAVYVVAEEILTNETIIKMVNAKLGESLIINKIKNSKTNFDLSTDAIIKLKEVGVSEKIIEALMSGGEIKNKTKPAEQSQTQPAPTNAPQGDDIYYARCNLKVLKGNQITWINWQSAPTFIPVGTELKVTKQGSTAILINTKNSSSYTLDIGSDGDAYLEKFVTKTPVDITKFPGVIQAEIRDAVIKIGMTKEQAYIAMGPPTEVSSSKTNGMTYENIMSADLWIYARRRFGKNIGIGFDPASGIVKRTEGIWGK